MTTQNLTRASGLAAASCRIRVKDEDFQVCEELGFEPGGDGEFLWVHLEKTALTTPQAAAALARVSEVAKRDVSWSGMKDRNAVTRQWLSIHLPGKPDPQLDCMDEPGLRVLDATRHARKLRAGTHAANRFQLTLRDVKGSQVEVDAALAHIRDAGVPNYFGEQRFGSGGGNLDRAVRRRGRKAQGMHWSALRSQIFNACLDRRVQDDTWCRVITGDVLQFSDGNSLFCSEVAEEDQSRVDAGQLHVTGPLWGSGRPMVSADAQALEAEIAAGYAADCLALDKAGLRADRRALRSLAQDLSWRWESEDVLILSFALRTGAYATAVLREIFEVDDASAWSAD